MNSLDRTGARDTLERLSLAVDQIAPFIAIGLFVPMALILTGVGVYAGYSVATEPVALTFVGLRILLGLVTGFSIVGPLVMPSMERASAIRLLLLPIRRGTLYLAHAASALTEPWVLMALPPVLAIPIGLAAGGAVGAAVIALVSGLLLILTLIGLVALSTTILHLIVRDRRRGELVTLFIVVVVPVLSLLPGLLASQQGRRDRRADRVAHAERVAHGQETVGDRVARIAQRSYTVLPSELFARATQSSAHTGAASALVPLAALAATAGGLHALAFLAFGRLLDSPGSSSRSRTRSSVPSIFRLPGLSRGAAAVAQAHFHLVLRTPRGRSTLLTPLAMFVVITLIAKQSGTLQIGPMSLSDGLGVATFGAWFALLSILPIAMNQFAVDRAGLTLAFLTPLATRQLLVGKAVATAMVVGIPALVCIVLAYLLFPGGSAALWISVPLGLLGTYALVAPSAAALSAVFPRAVDLNSIGSRSNAHGVANLLGLVTFVVASLPPALLTALSIAFERRALAPVLLALWCGVALILSRILLNAVALLFERRRENLALMTRPAS